MTDKKEQLKVIKEQLAKNADEMQAVKELQSALKLSSQILKVLDNDDKFPKTYQECLEDELSIGNSLSAIYRYLKNIDKYHLAGYEKATMQQACLEAIGAFGNYLPVIADIQNDLFSALQERTWSKDGNE